LGTGEKEKMDKRGKGKNQENIFLSLFTFSLFCYFPDSVRFLANPLLVNYNAEKSTTH
jgi:hypothetical protein